MKNFWNNDHPLAADNTRLYEQLVPQSGSCATVQGELLRAASKIAYDWYNNGWGCNNWSGAVVFLRTVVPKFALKRTPEEERAFDDALSTAYYYSHGEPCGISDVAADDVVTTIVAYVVQCVLDHPDLQPNTRDMYDMSEADDNDWSDEDQWDDPCDEY
jgi:hypothetical protein